MLFLKYLLLTIGIGLMLAAAATLLHQARGWAGVLRRAEPADEPPPPPPVSWGLVARFAVSGFVLILLSLSIVVVPAGEGGIRVSQISGTLPRTLYPGVHLALPLIQRVETFDIRDQVFTTASHAPAGEDKKQPEKTELLEVQTKEGLLVGISATVRYRLDSQRLAFVYDNLPKPVEREIVTPAVLSAFRQVVPNYMTREFFATKREEARTQAVEAITKRLAADAIVVKEVLIRDIVLPPEYAKGLEGLLLKEQESERLAVDVEIKKKEVETARLEAEAMKERRIKQAEGEAAVRVLQAKSEADAMQHTLPLKQKQIEQTRLESLARKEATVQNAEAEAQAKVIDAKAELEKRNLMAEAEVHRTRLMAVAEAERMEKEAALIEKNPLIIQKIIAERLSDKVQIMMVPMDGKFFFANDVLRTPQMMGLTPQPTSR